MPVDGLGVDRGPLAVGAVQQVRDDQVGVQLRVPGPRGVVLERGHDPAVRLDPVGALAVALVPAQPVAGDRLQVRQRLDRPRPGGRREPPLATSASPSANSTLTDLGAEMVTSIPGRRTSTRRSGEPQRGGVPVGPVLRPVHPAHVDPGRSGQPVGPGRRHGRWPAPARLVHPGLQTGEDRPVGRVREQVLDRHGLGRSPIPDRLDQRPGRQPAARVRPDHRRCRHPLSARRLPRQQVAQRLGAGRVDPSRQPGRRCPGSEPASGRFGAEVVVGRAVRLPGQVVAGRVRPRAEHRHRHHHRRSTARRDTDGPTGAARRLGRCRPVHAPVEGADEGPHAYTCAGKPADPRGGRKES